MSTQSHNPAPEFYRDGKSLSSKRALSIIRISTGGQQERYGLECQWEDDILGNARLLGLEVHEDLRRIIVESASGWNRPKFEQAIRDAIQLYDEGKIDAVVFPRVDRETRFVFSSLPLLSVMLQAGIEVYFARELLHLDPRDSEAVGKYLEKVGQSLAYIETVRVNTMRGRRNRAKGKPHNEIPVPGKLPTGGVGLYGFIYDKDTGKRIINELEVAVIRKIVYWLLEEIVSLGEICRRLMAEGTPAPRGGKRWGASTVSRILRNSVYTGVTYAYTQEAVEPRRKHKPKAKYAKTARRQRPREEWILLPEDTTPEIISQGEFDAIQRRLARNSELSPRNQKHHYLLRGYVYCQECRRKFYGVPEHGKRYYRCSGRSSLVAFGTPCRNRGVNADGLEEQVWELVVKTIFNADEWMSLPSDPVAEGLQVEEWEKEIEALNTRLTFLDNAETRLIRLFAATNMTELKVREESGRIQVERSKTQDAIAKLEDRVEKYQAMELTAEQIQALLVFLQRALLQSADPFDDERKCQIFGTVGLRVWIAKDGSFSVDFTVPAVPPREYNVASPQW